MIRFLLFIFKLCQKYTRDEMSVYAAQASFFTILAAFPFFMVLLSLIDLIPVIHASDLLLFLVDAMPDALDSLVITVIDNVLSGTSTALLSASAIAAVWSASRGILSIERGLNRAFHIEVQRNYFIRRLVCSGYTCLFTFMCAMSLLFLVFGNFLEQTVFSVFPALSRFQFIVAPTRNLAAFSLLFLFFLAFYVVLPYQKQKVRSQIPGALFSTAGWILFSYAFSLYFRHMGSFTPTYGSLTAVILMMLWLYFCICILFLGAEINALLSSTSRASYGR